MQPIYLLGALLYAVSAAGVLALSVLIGSALQRTVRESCRTLAAQLEAVNLKVARLEERAQAAPPNPSELAVRLGPEKRSQAVDMLKRGATAEIVSAALGGLESEIQLLMKIREIRDQQSPRPPQTSKQPAGEDSAARSLAAS
jgi:hypothetical protein